MEGEYLSDLSSSFDEEQPPQRKKVKRHDPNISNSSNVNNSNNNDNNNNNNNDYNRYNSINANIGSNVNAYDDNLNNNDNQLNSLFMSPRIREEQELREAIRLSLIETGKGNVIIPKYEDNFNNTSNRNSMSLNNPQMDYQFDEHHHHRHRKNKRETNNQNVDQPSIEQIILQSKKEEEDTKIIRDFLANKENLLATLVELPGVDPKDPCFKEFFE